MIYDLNKEIKTFDGEPIREMDNRMAGMVLQQCTSTLEDVTDDEEIVAEFKRKAPGSILGEAVTYRQVIRQSLMQFTDGENPSEKQQLARYDLMIKLAADTVELESSEITTIRKAVAVNYKHPIIIGRVRDLLEGKNAEQKKDSSKKSTKKK